MRHKIIILMMCIMCVGSFVRADVYQDNVVYIDKKTSQERGQAVLAMKKSGTAGDMVYELRNDGQGQHQHWKDVSWKHSSIMLEEDGLLKPVVSIFSLFDKRDKMMMMTQKVYDYETHKIRFQKFNSEGREVEKKTYPIEGPICDDINLMYFLEKFVDHQGAKTEGYEQFTLLTNESKFYTVNVYDRGIENIDGPDGIMSAMKLQLIGDLGPFTDLAAKLAPPTYVWMTPTKPHRWIQYEGLESGFGSKNIVIKKR